MFCFQLCAAAEDPDLQNRSNCICAQRQSNDLECALQVTFVGTALGTSMWCLSLLTVAADSRLFHQAHTGIALCVSYMPWILHTISALGRGAIGWNLGIIPGDLWPLCTGHYCCIF